MSSENDPTGDEPVSTASSVTSSTTSAETDVDQSSDDSGVSRGQRVLLSLLFALSYQVAEAVFWAVALFQNIYLLMVGERNERLNEFSETLSMYIYECVSYVSLRTDSRPWPFEEHDGDASD